VHTIGVLLHLAQAAVVMYVLKSLRGEPPVAPVVVEGGRAVDQLLLAQENHAVRVQALDLERIFVVERRRHDELQHEVDLPVLIACRDSSMPTVEKVQQLPQWPWVLGFGV
jgi:hypothetical protein